MLQIYFYYPSLINKEIPDKSRSRIFLKIIFLLISCLAEMISFYVIVAAFHFQSKFDFKNHKIGNLTDYFYILPNNTVSIRDECFYNNNNTSFHYNCSSEQKNLRFTNISYNNIFYLRKLASRSFCHEIYGSFIKYKGRPLSNIFNLNIKILYGLSIALIIIYCIFTLFFSFSILFIFSNRGENTGKKSCFKKFETYFHCCKIRLAMALINIAKFVLFILFIYFFEKGDIEKYDNFLECGNVRKKFFSKFTDVEILRKNYTVYWISTIISEGTDKLEQLAEIIFFPNENDSHEDHDNHSSDKSNNQSMNKYSTEISIKTNNLKG